MKILFVFECKDTTFILYMQIFFKKNALFLYFFSFFIKNSHFCISITRIICEKTEPLQA